MSNAGFIFGLVAILGILGGMLAVAQIGANGITRRRTQRAASQRPATTLPNLTLPSRPPSRRRANNGVATVGRQGRETARI